MIFVHRPRYALMKKGKHGAEVDVPNQASGLMVTLVRLLACFAV